MTASFQIGHLQVGLNEPLFVIVGPCVIESRDLCLQIAEALLDIQQRTGVGVVFKASFDKANRSSIHSFRGPGLDKGLAILDEVRSQTGLPVLTDVHEPAQAKVAGEVVDCLQIPAFLCRQTDLLVSCGQTQKPVNIKKGQFLSPQEMKNCVEKVLTTGNSKILLTERGTFFGYNRNVNDMTAIPLMQQFGCPVVFDATHSTQRPGGLGTASAGMPDMAPILARAAIAAGANALFIETHPKPQAALSDAACMLPLNEIESLVTICRRIHQLIRNP
jgi:2-dehydro-3-deoxyphosphooctonate aldolase (KDO 8-P synthase)